MPKGWQIVETPWESAYPELHEHDRRRSLARTHIWESLIVQQFVGSMDDYRARKGVILTTSTFTREGADYVQRIEGKKVVLVDGDRLAELLIEHDLGVTTTKTYALKEVSNDFFDQDEG